MPLQKLPTSFIKDTLNLSKNRFNFIAFDTVCFLHNFVETYKLKNNNFRQQKTKKVITIAAANYRRV